jgi:para-aminobenzoate synthetase component 1
VATFRPLAYTEDSSALFESVVDEPWAAFLDSGRPFTPAGRYDLIVARPVATLVTRGDTTEVRSGSAVRYATDDPFDLLRQALAEHRLASGPCEEVPFCGGALGYFAYDLARRIERLPTGARDAEGLPEMAVGIYPWAVVTDHVERRRRLVWNDVDGAPTLGGLMQTFSRAPSPSRREPFAVLSPIVSNLDRAAYAAAFARIQRYIRDGDCYQVNFAQRFSARVTGDPWPAYREVRRQSPAAFGAYLSLPFCKLLSNSPERFLEVRGRAVETRPIKGTRPRDADPTRDAALAAELAGSAKDRAENLMIVDLLRNDLGKSCEPGSIAVPRLFEVESFATVHHLVSTVAGRLRADRDAIDLLRGCFPGGSVTGAPKRRAMEIIEELEPDRRGIYCGSVAYLGFDGAMDSSIAIRTLVVSEGSARFWAGGGIVADSDEDLEYGETLVKAAAIRRVLEGCRPAEPRPE